MCGVPYSAVLASAVLQFCQDGTGHGEREKENSKRLRKEMREREERT